MRRVVITGMGIVSCLGIDKETVTESLSTGRSGISYRPDYEEVGMRSHVAGAVDIDFSEHIDRKSFFYLLRLRKNYRRSEPPRQSNPVASQQRCSFVP